MGGWSHGMNMWGDGGGMIAWMGVWWLFVVVGIGLLVYLAMRSSMGKAEAPMPAGPATAGGDISSRTQVSGARVILEERLARGEISADEFRELISVIETR